MSKFRVGDKVKVIAIHLPCDTPHLGEILTLVKKVGEPWYVRENEHPWSESQLELISKGEPMSKYSELKSRIEVINQNTTVKEWDDLLGEIGGNFSLCFPIKVDTGEGAISLYESLTQISRKDILKVERKEVAIFHYSGQCSKGEAIKKSMLWLLDHSDHKKDEKAEKIAEIKKQIEGLQVQIKELENANS